MRINKPLGFWSCLLSQFSKSYEYTPSMSSEKGARYQIVQQCISTATVQYKVYCCIPKDYPCWMPGGYYNKSRCSYYLDVPLMSLLHFILARLPFLSTTFQRLQEVNNCTYFITHRARKWGKVNTQHTLHTREEVAAIWTLAILNTVIF